VPVVVRVVVDNKNVADFERELNVDEKVRVADVDDPLEGVDIGENVVAVVE
jgi:hypothetical protein